MYAQNLRSQPSIGIPNSYTSIMLCGDIDLGIPIEDRGEIFGSGLVGFLSASGRVLHVHVDLLLYFSLPAYIMSIL